MATEGIDLLPIVDKNRKLLAAISRSEVLEAMRYAGKQQETEHGHENARQHGRGDGQAEQLSGKRQSARPEESGPERNQHESATAAGAPGGTWS